MFKQKSFVFDFLIVTSIRSPIPQFTSFSGAVQSFTEKSAGNDISKGTAYNALADKRSWEGMKNFFAEITN